MSDGARRSAAPFAERQLSAHRLLHASLSPSVPRDLWWNYPASRDDIDGRTADVPLSSRLWKAGMDTIYRPVYNRLMDADGTRASSYKTILSWDWDYIAYASYGTAPVPVALPTAI